MSADYQATEKLKLNGGITYNKADSEWDWDFYERTQVLQFNNDAILSENGTDAAGMYGSVNYDNWEMNNNISEYSDLSYEQYSITLGGTYAFTDAFYTTMQGTYDIFESDEEYVYGDEDGKAFSGYVAVGYKF